MPNELVQTQQPVSVFLKQKRWLLTSGGHDVIRSIFSTSYSLHCLNRKQFLPSGNQIPKSELNYKLHLSTHTDTNTQTHH